MADEEPTSAPPTGYKPAVNPTSKDDLSNAEIEAMLTEAVKELAEIKRRIATLSRDTNEWKELSKERSDLIAEIYGMKKTLEERNPSTAGRRARKTKRRSKKQRRTRRK